MKMTDRLLITAIIITSIFARSASADQKPGAPSVSPLLPPPVLSDAAPATTAAPVEMGTPASTAQAPATPAEKAPVARKKTAAKPVVKKAAVKKLAAPKYPEISVPLKPGPAVVSVKTRVNVRGGASTRTEILTRLTNGEPVTVIEEIVRENRKPDEPTFWAKIALPAGTRAWVFGQFVDATNKTVTTKKLNVRGGPGEYFSILATLQKGDPVTQLDEKEGWLQIEAPTNAVAYIAAAYLKQEAIVPVEAIAALPVETNTVTEAPPLAAAPSEAPPGIVMTNDIPTPAPTPATDPALAASPAMPAPDLPTILDPSIKRIVEREGIVRRTWSIQAPSDFRLVSPQTGEKIVYLYTDSPSLDLRRYKGLHIIVTGEEGLDRRWKDPVLTIRRIQVVE